MSVLGHTYGRLTVLEDTAIAGRVRFVRCRCTCGTTTIKRLDDLRSSATQSCGCLLRETTSARMRGLNPRAWGAGRKPQVTVQRYRLLWQGKGRPRIHIHRRRAELALGHRLPPGVVVHHADGSTADDAPLVICPHEDYHKELHRKIRVRTAGGNPWTDRLCGRCGLAKTIEHFTTSSRRVYSWCRDCFRNYHRARRLRQKSIEMQQGRGSRNP